MNDVSPPVLESIEVSPLSVDVTSGEKMVSVVVNVSDASGLDFISYRFKHEVSGQFKYVDFTNIAASSATGKLVFSSAAQRKRSASTVWLSNKMDAVIAMSNRSAKYLNKLKSKSNSSFSTLNIE